MLTKQVLRVYAEIAAASYSDALAGVRGLLAATDELLADPNEVTLARARDAWRDARTPYLQSEVFRFYGGPIDRLELLINTWPIDENFVEGTGLEKGLIDDITRFPSIEPALLVSLNAREGETSISTGYHVVEFLLWGRDTSATSPGVRSATDFVESAENPLAERRRRYLRSVSELLVHHLEEVARAWRDEPASYRKSFLALAPHEALGLVLRGMGTLSGPELAGERLTVPYETRDQENEHSCFSDTTHEDVLNDALGVENVCLGRYRRSNGSAVQGPGVCALIESLDPELGRKLSRQISASVAAARKIPAPFDQALLGRDDQAGREAIKQTIRALEAQAASLARGAARLGLGRQARTSSSS